MFQLYHHLELNRKKRKKTTRESVKISYKRILNVKMRWIQWFPGISSKKEITIQNDLKEFFKNS